MTVDELIAHHLKQTNHYSSMMSGNKGALPGSLAPGHHAGSTYPQQGVDKMAAATRIYVVRQVGTDTIRLIRGVQKNSVRSFAARDAFDVEVASQDALVQHIAAGVRVEDSSDAGDEPEQSALA